MRLRAEYQPSVTVKVLSFVYDFQTGPQECSFEVGYFIVDFAGIEVCRSKKK